METKENKIDITIIDIKAENRQTTIDNIINETDNLPIKCLS